MLNEDELLVFANKQDLSNAIGAAEIISQAQTANIYSGEYIRYATTLKDRLTWAIPSQQSET